MFFMMAARQCSPVTTGGRDRFDILTLSFFCPLQQTWQEKERGFTAETGKFLLLLIPHASLPLLPAPAPLLPLPPSSPTTHTDTHTDRRIYTSSRQHQKHQIGLLSHSGANSKMMCFWRGYNGIQCLSIWAQETCCQREYSSPLLQCSNTIAHIQHDSA